MQVGGGLGCGADTMTGISHLRKPEEAVTAILQRGRKAHYVMCDARKKPTSEKGLPGTKLRAYIKKHKLGELHDGSGWKPNPQHGPNYLKIYVWEVNWKGVAAWKKKTNWKAPHQRDYYW